MTGLTLTFNRLKQLTNHSEKLIFSDPVSQHKRDYYALRIPTLSI